MRMAMILSVLVGTIALLYALPVGAQQGTEPSISAGLFCDTAEQATMVITAVDKTAAMAEVNTPTAVCAVGMTAFIDTGRQTLVQAPEGTIAIKEVVVIALSFDGLNMQPIPPTVQFLPFLAPPEPKPAGLQI